MVAKRAAASSPASSKRQAKVAKKALPDCLSELLNDLSGDLPASAVSMLRASVPLAVMGERDCWHEYEHKVVEMLFESIEVVSGTRRAAIEAIKARMHNHSVNGQYAVEALQDLKHNTEAKMAMKVAAEQARKDAEAQLGDAEGHLESLRKTRESISIEVSCLASQKVDFEGKVEATLPALREGTFKSKDWRLRAKAISQLTALLEDSQAPESLIAAVSVALKENPGSRGEYGSTSIAFAGDLLQKFIESLVESGQKRQDHLQALEVQITQAQEAVTAAEKDSALKLEISMQAENDWLDADASQTDTQKRIDDHDLVMQELHDEMKGAETFLSDLLTRKQSFQLYCERQIVQEVEASEA